MIVALKLILAHLIGDFGLQFKSWVHHKEKHRLKSGMLYLHIAIHGLAVFILLWPEINADISYLWIPPVIMITHLLIDGVKLMIQNRLKHESKTASNSWEQILFLTDQFSHILVISIIWYVYEIGDTEILMQWFDEKLLLLAVCIFFLTQPSAIIIKILISGWLPESVNKEDKTLASAGKYIGILERLFVFGFILTNNWSGIGFLLAAKSVFRFGDLKAKEGIKLTEYILIGTLISFGTAILVSITYLNLLQAL